MTVSFNYIAAALRLSAWFSSTTMLTLVTTDTSISTRFASCSSNCFPMVLSALDVSFVKSCSNSSSDVSTTEADSVSCSKICRNAAISSFAASLASFSLESRAIQSETPYTTLTLPCVLDNLCGLLLRLQQLRDPRVARHVLELAVRPRDPPEGHAACSSAPHMKHLLY